MQSSGQALRRTGESIHYICDIREGVSDARNPAGDGSRRNAHAAVGKEKMFGVLQAEHALFGRHERHELISRIKVMNQVPELAARKLAAVNRRI
jgi:hypothetical protein